MLKLKFYMALVFLFNVPAALADMYNVYSPTYIINNGLVGVASKTTPDNIDRAQCLDKLEKYQQGLTSKNIHIDIEKVDKRSENLKKYCGDKITAESRDLFLESFICTQKLFDSWGTVKHTMCNQQIRYISLAPLKSAIVIPVKDLACALSIETPETVMFETNLKYIGFWKRTLGSNMYSFSQLLRNPLQVPLTSDLSFIVHVEIR